LAVAEVAFVHLLKKFSVLPVSLHDKYTNLELLGIDFINVRPTLRMFIVYRPPYFDGNALTYARLLTECLTDYSTHGKYMHLIVGDFNLPNINWDVMIGPGDDVNNTVLKFLLNNGYNQLVSFPTHGGNMLDLVLTDTDMIITNIAPLPPVGFSDHVALEFSVAITADVGNCDAEQPREICKYIWASADFDAMSEFLTSIDWMHVIHTNPCVTDAWAVFIKILKHTIDAFVPSFVTSFNHEPSKPRRSHAVRKLSAKKRQLWRCLSESPHDSLRRQKYRDCVDEWRRAIRTDELLAEERVVNANNVGAFYKYVFKRTTNHSGIGVVMDKNGLPTTDSQITANAFNTYFSSVGVADNKIILYLKNCKQFI